MSRTSKGHDLTRGPLARNMIGVAWPVMVSSLLMTLYSLADAFWLGKLGAAALVAPTVTMNVFFIAMALAAGLGLGGTALVAQYRGAGRTEAMNRAAGQTLILLVLVGLVVMIAGLTVAAPLLRLLRTPADAFADTLIYLRLLFAGMPLMFAFFVYQGISTGMGDTIGPLKINVLATVLNAALDPFLIFGWGPFPELGVPGAALAALAARTLAGVMSLHRLLHGEHDLKLRPSDLRWDAKLQWRVIKIGLPMSFGQAGTAIGFTLLIGVANSFGSAVTAAFGIGNRIINMALVPAFGLSAATATAIGQNLGANRIDRAERAVRISCAQITAILLPMTTLMFFFGAPISRLFISDPAVVAYGKDLFQITSFSVFVFGFIMIYMGAFEGSGHTFPVMVLNLSRLWLIRIPGTYLLITALGLGARGLWWAMFASNTVTAIAAAIWFSLGTWKRKVIEEEVLPPPVIELPDTPPPPVSAKG